MQQVYSGLLKSGEKIVLGLFGPNPGRFHTSEVRRDMQ